MYVIHSLVVLTEKLPFLNKQLWGFFISFTLKSTPEDDVMDEIWWTIFPTLLHLDPE